MRLTLRTLLSYLDDTLEPAQAKIIGQKVAESEQARELMDRISQVTRRRRLTTPPTSGPGGLDPNTMAEYLDNEVTPEQAAEVEQVCLASDVHLAEVAACHQILTLVLGEPALVPPSAKQRMYGLVKGPEAIPFRKPSKGDSRVDQDLSSELSDADETLRLGLPGLGGVGGWRNWALLVGGGAAVAALLVVALVLVLSGPGNSDQGQIAQGNQPDEGKPAEKKTDKAEQGPPPAPVVPEKEAKTDNKKPPVAPAEAKAEKTEEPAPEFPPFAEPDTTPVRLGRVMPVAAKELPPLLFQYVENKEEKDKSEWQRLGQTVKSDVFSARPLVALPGSRGTVQLNRGIQLTLWGNMPELNRAPLYESMVEVYHNDDLTDLLLRRGRILLTNTTSKPALARLRYEHPHTGKYEYFDITLAKDSTLLVERWSYMPTSEPFYPNPKDKNRVGPAARVNCAALAGSATVRVGGPSFTLFPPPDSLSFLLIWDSTRGPQNPQPSEKLPLEYQDNPELPKEAEKLRTAALKAEEGLTRTMEGKALDVALNETMQKKDEAARRLVVRCYGAVDDLTTLLDQFEKENAPKDVRDNCIGTLRDWIAYRRDAAYDLLKLLKERYPKGGAALKIVEMLHYLPKQRLEDPVSYESLIDDLANPILLLRELSAWHLYQLVPGQKIGYDPTGTPASWANTQEAWFKVIPRGQLPPRPAAPAGKKS